MEMHQVRYFLAVARTLNFTRAAEECNVAQPSLTRAIKLLEGELGGDLFRRERPRAMLTPLGERMYPLLKQCYDSAQSARALATIGRSHAVAQFGRFKVSGFLAWVLWSVVHVYFLIGLRNRFIVALNWAWSYLTFQRGSRLITGLDARAGDKQQSPRTGLHSKAS